MDVSTQIAELKEAHETYKTETNRKLDQIGASVQEIVTVMRGGMGMPGITDLLRAHEQELQQVRQSRAYQKGVIAVISVVGGAVGSLGVAVFKFLTAAPPVAH